MDKDQITGVAILAGGIAGIVIYLWLIFLSPWTGFIAGLTLFLAVAALLLILGWIGWTMATTPPPKPMEDLPPPPPEKKEELKEEPKAEKAETKAEPSSSHKAVIASPKRRGRGRA